MRIHMEVERKTSPRQVPEENNPKKVWSSTDAITNIVEKVKEGRILRYLLKDWQALAEYYVQMQSFFISIDSPLVFLSSSSIRLC